MDEQKEFVKRAERHIFATGPRDCGQSLCVANMKCGYDFPHMTGVTRVV